MGEENKNVCRKKIKNPRNGEGYLRVESSEYFFKKKKHSFYIDDVMLNSLSYC